MIRTGVEFDSVLASSLAAMPALTPAALDLPRMDIEADPGIALV